MGGWQTTGDKATHAENNNHQRQKTTTMINPLNSVARMSTMNKLKKPEMVVRKETGAVEYIKVLREIGEKEWILKSITKDHRSLVRHVLSTRCTRKFNGYLESRRKVHAECEGGGKQDAKGETLMKTYSVKVQPALKKKNNNNVMRQRRLLTIYLLRFLFLSAEEMEAIGCVSATGENSRGFLTGTPM